MFQFEKVRCFLEAGHWNHLLDDIKQIKNQS